MHLFGFGLASTKLLQNFVCGYIEYYASLPSIAYYTHQLNQPEKNKHLIFFHKSTLKCITPSFYVFFSQPQWHLVDVKILHQNIKSTETLFHLIRRLPSRSCRKFHHILPILTHQVAQKAIITIYSNNYCQTLVDSPYFGPVGFWLIRQPFLGAPQHLYKRSGSS